MSTHEESHRWDRPSLKKAATARQTIWRAERMAELFVATGPALLHVHADAELV